VLAWLSNDQMSRTAPASDEALVARARAGDRGACRQLVERYETQVVTTVVGMLGRSDEVDDVAQETFIRFFESLERFRGDSSVGTYLTRIAINLSINAARRRKRWLSRFLGQDAIDSPEHEPVVDESGQLEHREEIRMVQAAIQELEPRYRAVLVLRVIDGFSTRETATMLNIPLGTVLSRLSRAQTRLRDLLKPYIADRLRDHEDLADEQTRP
jgi:RNA polymerase sigma-70 factor, ECF subfamily